MKTKNSIILFFLLYLLGLARTGLAQELPSKQELKNIKADKEYENVLVKKLYSDVYVSTFVIWIKKEVKTHRHNLHTEQVLILEGKAKMWLNGKESTVKKGDWVFIPEKAVHQVKVLGNKPLKVLSVQTPEFKGKDREFVEE